MVKIFSDREYQDLMNSPSVQKKLDEQAKKIQAQARSRINSITGETADSVVIEDALRDDGVLVRRIGYDLDISDSGPYYEFGTEDTLAHPVLRIAAAVAKGS